MAHGGHNCGGCCDHDTGDPTGDNLGLAYSLYLKVHLDRVECLNEAVDGSGKTILKPWEDRMDMEKYVESDADEELLLKIPFTGNVKLKGLIVRGLDDDSHPSTARLFKNNPNMGFDDTSAEADQEFELQHDPTGTVEYPVKIVKFQGVSHLTIHFPKNFGNEKTRIYYIGLKGDWTKEQRDAILIANYELAANPCDHATKAYETAAHNIGH